MARCPPLTEPARKAAFSVTEYHFDLIVTHLKTLRRFLVLEPERRTVLLQALLLPGVVSAGFHIVGVPRTQAWLRRWAAASTPGRGGQHSGIALVQNAQRVIKRRLGIEGTCLTRSLTLWAMLRRRSINADLRVGFRRSEGKLEGHAWVEFEGIVLNEAEEVKQSYTPFTDPAAFDARHNPDRWK